MNIRIIFRYLGYLSFLEAIFMLPAVSISWFRAEAAALRALVISVLLLCLLGCALLALGRRAAKVFYAREGFITVACAWLLFSAMGALPFYLSGEFPSLIDSLFESISGFTTTGASILINIEAVSHGLLYWRSFTHWLGGMGMLVFLLAIVPASGEGHVLHLLRAESPGPAVGKLVPKMRQTATILYGIYIILTLLCFLFLLAGGMPVFDSLTTAFATAGTGGFSIKNDSLAGYSPYLQSVCTVFMMLFGINFSIYYLLLIRDFSSVLFDQELRAYLGIMLLSTLLITWNILPVFESLGTALHHAAFTVSSIMTTTGFAISDFNLWPQFSRGLLVMLMIAGSSAGSTGGGIKIARLLILVKSLGLEIRRMMRPRSVQVIKINGRVIDQQISHGVDVYMTAYCVIAILSFLLISLDNLSFESNATAVLACINNVGPGLDAVGPVSNYAHFSGLSKMVLSVDMLLGRLEIFPLLILISPSTWKRRV